MGDLLFLSHRLPFPPNKGDKVRSHHLLRHLAASHRVHVGTFVDDPADEQYIPQLAKACAGYHVARLSPRAARLRSVAALAQGEPLTVPYYYDRGLDAWVRDVVRRHDIRAAFVFSSAMAQYTQGLRGIRVLIDFVDVDSAKWSQYATSHRWPLSWVYAREAKRLLDFERAAAARSARSFFVTEAEAALFRSLAPECSDKVEVVCNGVDAAYFSPEIAHRSPFQPDETPIVFTGAMDYWPNVDAACWFVSDVLPLVRARRPDVRFYVVGMRPAPAVRALAADDVVVTGAVEDVRPFVQHASLTVAPLRVARGIQNKILEAMAMGKAVVASRSCAAPLDAVSGQHLMCAVESAEFADHIDALLREPQRAAAIGSAARRLVLARYSWQAHLSRIDAHLDPAAQPIARAGSRVPA